MRRLGREGGIVLLAALLVMMVLFATSSVVVSFSVSESSVLNGRLDETAAFFLAEGAIEAAKYEIGQGIDTAADGIGNVTGSKTSGTFDVAVTDLGGGVYELLSQGTGAQGTTVTIQTTVEIAHSTVFPPGGMSFVGDLDPADVTLDLDGDFILDGGNGAAMTFGTQALHDWFADELAHALHTDLPAQNLSGGTTTIFNHNGVDYELPLALETSYDTRLQDLQDTYDALRSKAQDLQVGATQILGHNEWDFAVPANNGSALLFDSPNSTTMATFGSPESPVTFFADENLILDDELITGYGTLIVGDNVILDNTTIDWNGSVFVKGEGILGAMVMTNGSTLNVTGNLVNLGEAAWFTYIGAWGGSQVNVDGNFFVGSNWNDSSWARGYLDIAGGSTVSVDGVLTMIGRKSGIDTDGRADNNLFVNGMMQLAVPNTTSIRLNLDFDGVVEVHRDSTLIHDAMDALHELGVEQNIVTAIERIVSSEMTETMAWKKIPPGQAKKS